MIKNQIGKSLKIESKISLIDTSNIIVNNVCRNV